MIDKEKPWNSLSTKDKAYIIKQAVIEGYTDLNEIKQLYNEAYSLNNVAKQQNPNIIQKLNQDNLKTIDNWKNPKYKVSHKIGSYGSSPQHFMSARKYDDGGPKEGDYFGAHLPEVEVVAKKPNKRLQFTGFPNVFRDASILDSQLQKTTNILGYLPVMGEYADVVSTVNDAANKRYLDAGLGIAAMGIPFIPGSAVKKYVKEPIKKVFNKTVEGLSDFYRRKVQPKLAGMHIGDWYFVFPKLDENYMYRQSVGVYPNVEARGALYPESKNQYKKRVAAYKKAQAEEYFKTNGEYPKSIINKVKGFQNNLMFNQGKPFYEFNYPKYDEVFVVPKKGIADWNKVYHKRHQFIREPRVDGELMLPLEDFEYYKRPKILPGYIKFKDVGETKLHKFRLFDGGGPKGGEYNIFEDPESFEGRDQHRKSLDTFVKNNPKLYGLNTADFVDFLSQIAGLESGYRSGATTDASKYSGYYGLKNGHTFDVDTQHKKAFQHLASIFKENITKQDIDKAISLGITPSQLLAKYWNQGNRVTNYLYNGTDNTDALGTKISKYGWNVTAPVEYKHLVPEGITQDFVLVENAKSLADATKLARNQYIDYSDRDAYIKKVNVERYKNKKRNPKFIDTKLQVGDTIFLTPMNVPIINKK